MPLMYAGSVFPILTCPSGWSTSLVKDSYSPKAVAFYCIPLFHPCEIGCVMFCFSTRWEEAFMPSAAIKPYGKEFCGCAHFWGKRVGENGSFKLIEGWSADEAIIWWRVSTIKNSIDQVVPLTCITKLTMLEELMLRLVNQIKGRM